VDIFIIYIPIKWIVRLYICVSKTCIYTCLVSFIVRYCNWEQFIHKQRNQRLYFMKYTHSNLIYSANANQEMKVFVFIIYY